MGSLSVLHGELYRLEGEAHYNTSLSHGGGRLLLESLDAVLSGAHDGGHDDRERRRATGRGGGGRQGEDSGELEVNTNQIYQGSKVPLYSPTGTGYRRGWMDGFIVSPASSLSTSHLAVFLGIN